MNYYEYFEAFLAGGKDKNRRRVSHNTYAERLANGNIGLRYHATVVCEYWPNGNVTLRSGGWQTVTTQRRIHAHSPARVYSVKGSWCVYHASDPVTAAKIQKCRGCKGTGVGKGWTCWGPNKWQRDHDGNLAETCYHGKTEMHEIPGKPGDCYGCKGTGERDYGSKRIPTPFYDGVVVDMYGMVISKAPTYPAVHAQHDAPKSAPSVSGDTILAGLASVIPGLSTAIADCPACKAISGYSASPNLPILKAVMHLNDVHKWSRGQIADWLETLDADLSFSVTNK